MSVKDINENNITTYKYINTTSFIIDHLQGNVEYVMRVAAYTTLGKGPWSLEFRGKSLRNPESGKQPTILWSSKEGLFGSDITGENVKVLIKRDVIKDHYFTDLAWYQDKMFLVSTDLKIFLYTLNNHIYMQLVSIDCVGSIAVDWIGKKLYWSNPKQQLVSNSIFMQFNLKMCLNGN